MEAILAEHQAGEARVVDEQHTRASRAAEKREFTAAYDLAQRELLARAAAAPTDIEGREFALCSSVESIRRIPYQNGVYGLANLQVGTRGEIVTVGGGVGDERVAVQFDGLAHLYLFQSRDLRGAVKVVG